MVPEGRRLFPSLTLEENLKVGATFARKGPWTIEKVYELFPWMKERRRQKTAQMSGGEQQSVAIGRALVANPRVLLLDELSLGLAPVIMQRIYAMLPQILASGMTVLLVEQDVSQALRVATHLQCLLEGHSTLEGRPADVTAAQVEAAYFGAGLRPASGGTSLQRPPACPRGAKPDGLGQRHHPGHPDRRSLRAVRVRAFPDVRRHEGGQPRARRPRRGRGVHRRRGHRGHPHAVPVVRSHRRAC